MPIAIPPPASSTAMKILRPPPGGSPGLTGSFMAPTLTRVRTPSCGLARALAALLLEAPLAACLGRLRRPSRARHVQRAREPLAQSRERELAVARLAARVLRDRGHARAAARHDAPLLLVGQRVRGAHVEHGLDARGGHVRVLAAGAGRPARAK